MRYMAQRAITGEWITRDLPFHEVERTRDLSGPGGITATISPELRDLYHTDGLRVLEEWATYIYACTDDGRITHGTIFVDAQYDEASLVANCPGFTTYPHGYIYGDVRSWGPDPSKNLDRPDPLQIVQDHWDYIQAQDDSDLGVRLVGTLKSDVRVGDNAEPYRLRNYEVPDLGNEIDNLAASTPFDYIEEHEWLDDAHTKVDHRVRLGWPRVGAPRNDLRFVLGENVTSTIPATTSGGTFANDVMGVGNGEGTTMAQARSTVRDGHLRRTRVLTDKTLLQADLARLVRTVQQKTSATLDITSVQIYRDHPHAPVDTISPGDDIEVHTYLPSYGPIDLWVRVTSIAEDDSDLAVLTTTRSSSFLYSSTAEISG